MSEDIAYLWFCLKCQTYHDSPYCPNDKADDECSRVLPGTIKIDDDDYYSLR